ncbi:MAG: hypothetical protein WDO69_13400 [Pseudomonadota bacterium]
MTKYPQLIKLRWPTLATLAFSVLLPGCPLTDNYFTQSSDAGSGPAAAGASGLSGADSSATAGLGAGSCASCGDPSGGSGIDAGSASMDAGSTGTDAGGTGGGAPDGNGGSATGGGSAGGGETAGSPSNLPEPACNDGVVKGSTCTAASSQFCYKSCGPDNLGFKSETCQNGAYVEQSVPGCSFPAAQDYSCYKLPSRLPSECPTGVPRGGRPCQISSCTVCFGGAATAPQYQDSTGVQKPGFCVCAGAVWTCASTTSWPCPDGQGCD